MQNGRSVASPPSSSRMWSATRGLMAEDEAGALAALNRHRETELDPVAGLAKAGLPAQP